MADIDYSVYDISPESFLSEQLINATNQQDNTGIRGVGRDIAESVKEFPSHAWEATKGLPRAINDARAQLEEDPLRALQNALSGTAKAGQGVANFIPNVRDYLQEKELISPDTLSGFPRAPEFEPQEEGADWIREALGLHGQQRGDESIEGFAKMAPYIFGGEAGLAGKSALRKGAQRTGALSAHDIGQNQNPIDSALAIMTPWAVGKVAKGAKKGYQTVSNFKPEEGIANAIIKGTEAVARPYSELSEAERFIESLKEAEKGSKTDIANAQTEAAKNYGDIFNKQAIENASRDAQIRHYAPQEEAAARANVREGLKGKYAELYEEAGQKYDAALEAPVDNKGSPIGEQPLKHNLDPKNLTDNYRDALTQLEEDAFFEKRKPIENIKDLIDLRRDITTERLNYGKRSIDKTLPPSDTRHAGFVADSLKELEDYLNLVIENEFTSRGQGDAYQALKLADQWYSEMIQPFRTNKFLKEAAVNPKGNIKVPDVFDTLNEIGADKLVERIIQDKKLREVIAKHDLMKYDLTTEAGLDKALAGDFGRALPDDIRKILAEHGKGLEKTKIIEAAQGQIAAGELQRLIKEPKMQQIFKEHPELLKPLDNIKDSQARLSALKLELEKAGIKKDAAKVLVDRYNKVFSIIGVVTGYKLLGKLFK